MKLKKLKTLKKKKKKTHLSTRALRRRQIVGEHVVI